MHLNKLLLYTLRVDLETDFTAFVDLSVISSTVIKNTEKPLLSNIRVEIKL